MRLAGTRGILAIVSVALGAVTSTMARPLPVDVASPIVVSTSGARHTEPADLDGDGDTDVIVAAATAGTVTWHENLSGDGSSWSTHTISSTAPGAQATFAADLDGDGDLDVAVVSFDDDRIAWHENTGGAFVEHTIEVDPDGAGPMQGFADGPRAIQVADLDDDGDGDLLCASELDDRITWFENADGQGGSWVASIVSSTGDGARSVRAADMNRDGSLDIVAASSTDSTVVWYDNRGGDGSFWILKPISTTADGVRSIDVADVDRDGDPDVVATLTGGGSVSWYENPEVFTSAWNEQPIATGVSGPTSIEADDVDGDGDIDVVVASEGDDSVVWHENASGDGTLWTPRSVAAGVTDTVFAALGDVDGDGDRDFLTASPTDGNATWHRNRLIHLRAAFPARDEIADGSSIGPEAVAVADVDRDGDPDLLVANGFDDLWLHENLAGDATAWSFQNIDNTADLTRAISAGDIDDDGDIDLAAAIQLFDYFVWYENSGEGSMWEKHFILSINGPWSVELVDMDRDGDLDMLTGTLQSSMVQWLPNTDGLGTFGVPNVIAQGNFPREVKAADIDGDGDPDTIVTRNNVITWYENLDGSGTAWSGQDVTTDFGDWQVVDVADVDRDGDLDLITAARSSPPRARWMENVLGDGSSWTERMIPVSFETEDAAVGDVDGDGDVDLLLGGEDTIWVENLDGAGMTWAETVLPWSVFADALMMADLDGSGRTGFIVGDFDLDWWPNRGGQFDLETSDLVGGLNPQVAEGGAAPMLEVLARNNGRTGEDDAELVTLEVVLETEDGVALTTAEAEVILDRLEVYRDDGSGVFETANDTLVLSLTGLALSAGAQTLSFVDDDPQVSFANTGPTIFFVVAEIATEAFDQAPRSLRLTHTEASGTAEHVGFDLVLEQGVPEDVVSSVIRDCDSDHTGVWIAPTLVDDLLLSKNPQDGAAVLSWTAPDEPAGFGATLFYDTMRSTDAFRDDDGVCIETLDGPDTTAEDPLDPPIAQVLFYLVRPRNDCLGPIGAAQPAWYTRTVVECVGP